MPYLALDRYIERQREDYYIVLKRCSGGKFDSDTTRYDYGPFLRFMIKVINRAMGDIELYRKRYASLNQLPSSALRVLQAFKERPETRLQRKEILAQTALPRATVTVALRTLTNAHFIQRLGRGAAVRYRLVF